MNELASLIIDTLLLFLSPLNTVYFETNALIGLAALILIIICIIATFVIFMMMPPQLGVIISIALWLGTIGLIQVGTNGGEELGFIGYMFLIQAGIVRMFEGAGFLKGVTHLISPFGVIALIITSCYALLVIDMIDFQELSTTLKVLGTIHIAMFLFSLTGIGYLSASLYGENALTFCFTYGLMVGSMIFIQFMNMESFINHSSWYETIAYYFYIVSFPIGLTIAFLSKPRRA